MPPLPRIRTDALARLAEALRPQPREALLRDIGRAEALAGEIEPEVHYPADWVVFRVTDERPEMDAPALIPGEALLKDLSALVERLCEEAGYREADLEESVESADQLAARWSVSRKTIDRWRRQGLVARRVRDGMNQAYLVFGRGATEAFAARRPDLLQRAGGFSRIDEATQARMIRRAERYHAALGCSLNQAAERIARRFGRSHEAIRQLLMRDETRRVGRGAARIFDDPAPLDDRAQRAIERAWRRGIEPSDLMRRYRRSRAGIHRIVAEQRARRLRSLDLGRVAAEAEALDPREIEEVLSSEPARAIEHPGAPTDVRELVAFMRVRVVPVGVEERARARAEQALRARVGRVIASLSATFPETSLLDRAETDLRWAAALRAPLARTHLRLVIETLESSLGVDLGQMRGVEAIALIESGVGALRTALDAYDPWKSGRLAAGVGLAVARVAPLLQASRAPAGSARRRAQVLLSAGSRAPDWTLLVSPWRGAVDPDARIGRVAGGLDRPDTPAPGRLGALLIARFGLGGAPPRTLAELAGVEAMTIMQAGRRERNAVRAALEASRSTGEPGGQPRPGRGLGGDTMRS